jgi:hypothetical protein
MTTKFWKTPGAADELGVSYSRLINLIRFRRMDPPAKDSSNDYVWTEQDLERARQALAAGRRKRKPVATEAAEAGT